MPGRGKLESKLFSRLGDIRSFVDQMRKRSPEVLEEMKTLLRHPRSLGAHLEERSPWLNRHFLGAASNLSEPFLVGMGLRVERLGEDAVEVILPGGWRNQGEGGLIHAGALATLGEFTSRLFWEHHLGLQYAEIEVVRVHLKSLARAAGDMRAVYRLPVSDREVILHRLRAQGRAEVSSEAAIYDRDARLVAEVEVEWRIQRHLALGPGNGAEK